MVPYALFVLFLERFSLAVAYNPQNGLCSEFFLHGIESYADPHIRSLSSASIDLIATHP